MPVGKATAATIPCRGSMSSLQAIPSTGSPRANGSSRADRGSAVPKPGRSASASWRERSGSDGASSGGCWRWFATASMFPGPTGMAAPSPVPRSVFRWGSRSSRATSTPASAVRPLGRRPNGPGSALARRGMPAAYASSTETAPIRSGWQTGPPGWARVSGEPPRRSPHPLRRLGPDRGNRSRRAAPAPCLPPRRRSSRPRRRGRGVVHRQPRQGHGGPGA